MSSAMSAISSIAAGLGGIPTQGTPAMPTPTGPAAAPFSDLLTESIGDVNQLESQAKTAVSGLMTGSGVDVHQAMISTQKASMAFELSLAVRNKAVQAYQQVMSMQF